MVSSCTVMRPACAPLLSLSLVLLLACGGSRPPSTAAPTPAPEPAPKSADAGASLTAAECEAAGGHVVGDIGDGAIHRPGYRCAGSGEPPIGPIAPAPGEPIAVEGSVCCR